MDHPKISIVTPSFNQGKYLEQTILSVIGQNYPNLEYIIIDGGSSDNSVEIIKKYEKQLTYWVSEKDRGQSHAINKGLAKSTGNIFNWLCSDDTLAENSLQRIGSAFRQNPDIHCYTGNLRKFKGDETLEYYHSLLKDSWADTLKFRIVKQPSTFFSKYAVEKMGKVNESLHYCMDVEWLWKFLFQFAVENIYEEPNFVVANYRIHEHSKSNADTARFILEDNSIMHFFAKEKHLTKQYELLKEDGIVEGYLFPKELLNKVDTDTIESIVFYYLLRRSVQIYIKQDFLTAQKFIEEIPLPRLKLHPAEITRMNFLIKYVKNKSWLSFQLKRAYQWRIKKRYLEP